MVGRRLSKKEVKDATLGAALIGAVIGAVIGNVVADEIVAGALAGGLAGVFYAGYLVRKVRGSAVRLPSRHIPQDVKIAVSARDGGKCRICGSRRDLQYDHIVPYSKGGSSTDPNNIQLLCGYHNRLKRDR